MSACPLEKAVSSQRPSLYGLGVEGLKDIVLSFREPHFRVRQLMGWLYTHPKASLKEMTDLTLSFRGRLEQEFSLWPFTTVVRRKARDGALKWAFRLNDGAYIESVFIPGEGKGTLCLSSQAGCALECSFCATARVGFNRNLKLEEIMGQLGHAILELGRSSVHRIVFMGMGEPLLNLNVILEAIRILVHKAGPCFSPKRVTVSTSGVVPGILRLANEAPGLHLAVSLNAPDDERRSRIMSIAKKYPLKELLDALRVWTEKTKQAVTLEYVLLPGLNMEPTDAKKICFLTHGLPIKINLIPFNPFPGALYRAPSDDEIDGFARSLYGMGLSVQVRRPRGLEGQAACGQLGSSLIAHPFDSCHFPG
jgi:23S rRNA (adenine2503-C2)-methyltransferase